MTRALLALLLAAGLTGSARADFVVTADFKYVDRAFTFGGFTGAEPELPIRRAVVQVVNAGNSLTMATGVTDDSGHAVIPVVASGTADVIVRAVTFNTEFGPALRVTDTVNTMYSVSSAVFTGWDLSTNLNAGTMVAGKVLVGATQGNPFNVFDQFIRGIEYVKSLGAPNPPVPLRMVWPGSGSFAQGTTAFIATDDGYDDLVILHELGHLVHDAWSDNDQPGAPHSFGESDQDPRLSFGEGWASFFAGLVRQHQGQADPGFYLDCLGQGQIGLASVQIRMRYETGFPLAANTGGEADEGAVFCALWDMVDDAGTNDGIAGDDDPIDGSVPWNGGTSAEAVHWQVFTGPVNGAPELTIRDFWNGLFTPVDHGQHAGLPAVFAGWFMRFVSDGLEPDDTPTPYVLTTSWGPVRTLYRPTGALPAPGEGDVDEYAFPLTAGSTFELETRYPGGDPDAGTYCDPRLVVLRPDGTPFALDDDGGSGRNAKLGNLVADVTGNWRARVESVHAYRRTGSYQFRGRLLAGPPGGCANRAVATTFGTGKPGAGGTPDLVATNLPVVPSAAFQMKVTGAPRSFPGVLLLGVTPVDLPFDDGHLYVAPLALVGITSDPAGNVLLAAPLANPVWCGLTVHLQAMFLGDPGASGFDQTSQTNRLTLTVGG